MAQNLKLKEIELDDKIDLLEVEIGDFDIKNK